MSRYSVRRIVVSMAVAVAASAGVLAGTSIAGAQPTLLEILADASTGSAGSTGDTPVDTKTYSGDATYFNAGLGSCGGMSANTDYVVAISASIWTRALCGKRIMAMSGMRSVTVTIVDTCPGCAAGDLDFSPAAFKKLGNLSDGRIPITWHFID
ncbi:rare lipoprotein A (RlpA)-like double-psi beta-barrel protein [Rhodococcus sp. OK302]|nr:rare lipoprotein A (RlpA)-like double-psi beta-barrel protein [Rhodococcus sp. OK302]